MSKNFYVIRDKEGNYIAPGNFISSTKTLQGWHYLKLIKKETGFVFYDSKKIAEKDLQYLRGLCYDFHLEYIDIENLGKHKSKAI